MTTREKSFRQVTLPPRRVYLVGAVLVALAVVVGALAVPIDSGASVGWLAAAAGMLLVGTLLLVSSIRFAFDGRDVRILFFPLYRVTIALADVAGVDVIEYLQVSDTGGMGVRRRGDRGRNLLYDAGPAIRLVTVDGRTFAVRSRYPGEAVRALAEALI